MALKDKVNMTVSLEGRRNYFYIEKDVRETIENMYEYLDIALDELEDLNKEDTLNMLKIRDNYKRLKEILKDSVFGDFTDN